MKEEVTKILENARQSIVTNLMAAGITTTGKTANSLQVVPYDGGVKLISDGSGAPITTTEIGRKAGKQPPYDPDVILQWTIDKGLSFESEEDRKSFAFATSKKIGLYGYGRPSRSDYGNTDEIIYSNVLKSTREILTSTVTGGVSIILKNIISNRVKKNEI